MSSGEPSRVPWPHGQAPATWGAVAWPEWIPAAVRAEVASFWSPENGRGPVDYERAAYSAYNNSPALGEVVTLKSWTEHKPPVTGRWVYCWNNIGRVVDGDGAVHCQSTVDYKRPRP